MSVIGACGMGEVYHAVDLRLGRDVALKLALTSDPARLGRFAREARVLASLNHPHIVTIYSVDDAEGLRFLTMELVEGQALDRLIPPGGLSLGRFLQIALPLADALTAAHQRNIVHRDLKPAKIMVTRDGAGEHDRPYHKPGCAGIFRPLALGHGSRRAILTVSNV